MSSSTGTEEPSLARVMTIDVEVGDPIDVGETGKGHRLVIPITGGSVSGKVSGTVLDAGADYQLFRLERPTKVDARYAFETDDGSAVYVRNEGLVHASADLGRELFSGEGVDSVGFYFRTNPTFETDDPDLSWLTEHLFVATVTSQPGGVRVIAYRVD